MPRVSASKNVLPNEQDRPDIARKRAFWRKYQGRMAPKRLVFSDEPWTKTNMEPLRGWALRAAADLVDTRLNPEPVEIHRELIRVEPR